MMEDIFFKDPIFLWLLLFFPIIIIWYFFTSNRSQALLKISSIKGFESKPNLFLKNDSSTLSVSEIPLFVYKIFVFFVIN